MMQIHRNRTSSYRNSSSDIVNNGVYKSHSHIRCSMLLLHTCSSDRYRYSGPFGSSRVCIDIVMGHCLVRSGLLKGPSDLASKVIIEVIIRITLTRAPITPIMTLFF